jgi:phosphoglycerol transferase MdoB-like AlkP superfamily enzyme
MRKTKNDFKDRLKSFLSFYVWFSLVLFGCVVLIRFLEFSYAYFYLNRSVDVSLLVGRSLNFDFLFSVYFLSAQLVIASLISILHEKIARSFTILVGFVFILCSWLITQYFLTVGSLLSSMIFDFSLKEIWEISANEFSSNRLILIICLGLTLLVSATGLLWLLPKWLKNKMLSWRFIGVYLITVLIGWMQLEHAYKPLKYFQSTYRYQIGNSKWMFLLKSTWDNSFEKEISLKNLKTHIERFQKSYSSFTYTSEEYPLMHKADFHNVLGPYFKEIDTNPNIVVLISEGLSASFTGKTCQLNASLTPFLDSLANQSLVWTNFFSNARRSYGALPNILSSAPHGSNSRGLINTKKRYANQKMYPRHLSLIHQLKDNGYYTAYYYGGWGYFDNVGFYLKELGIDRFFSEDDFDKKTCVKVDGTWGYHDKDLFSQSLLDLDKVPANKPFLAVYQTLSNHSPFDIVTEEYKDAAYIARRLRDLGLDKSELNRKKQLYDHVLGSIIFSDDALRQFFSDFSKREDFQNTIFIITGDHGIDLNLSNGIFENYQVPLLIYSPLLMDRDEFHGVSSHIDILPSLLALLQETYRLEVSQIQHYLGIGLDTSLSFRAERFVPLNLFEQGFPNLILGNHVLYDNEGYELLNDCKKGLQLKTADSEILRNFLDMYQTINYYTCEEDKIWNPKTSGNQDLE